MKQTIFILITELDAGGAEQIVFDLATRIRRFRPVVLALDGRGVYAGRLREAGVEVIDLGAYSRTDFKVLFRLRDLLLTHRPALLHCHLIHATIVGRLAAFHTATPVLSTCHIVERRPVRWHFWLNRLTARLGVGETCVSQAVRSFQINQTGIHPEFFSVLYNGINPERFRTPPDQLRARQALGLEPDVPVVGFLGRFDRQKGVDVLLEALKLPPLERVRLILGGYGPEEEALRAQALPFREWVRFCGYQEDPALFYAACDVIAMPSRWEGFGLVALEVLACGKPLVSTDVDALPEFLVHEQNALLVPPENPLALASALRRALSENELQEKFSAAGPLTAQKFSLTRMVEAYEDLYGALIDE